MSQPSLDEATHYRLDPVTLRDQYFKVGEETVYTWSDARNCWTFSLNNPQFIKALPGITELRKPVISPVVEASDRLGRTGTKCDVSGTNGYNPFLVHPTWATMKPEELQPVEEAVSEEHGCTEKEVEEVNEALGDGEPDPIEDATFKWEEYKRGQYAQQNRWVSDLDEPQHPNDKQVGGDHYKEMSLQPWEVVDQWGTKEQAIGYYLFSAVAYIGRYNSEGEGKGGLKDIQKAKHYLEKLESILLEE